MSLNWPNPLSGLQGSHRSMLPGADDAGGDHSCIRHGSGTSQMRNLTDGPHQLYEAALVPILWVGTLRHQERLTNTPWQNQDAAPAAQPRAGLTPWASHRQGST